MPATAAGPGGWGAPPGGDRSWKRPVQRADQAKPEGTREKSAFDPRCVKKPWRQSWEQGDNGIPFVFSKYGNG